MFFAFIIDAISRASLLPRRRLFRCFSATIRHDGHLLYIITLPLRHATYATLLPRDYSATRFFMRHTALLFRLHDAAVITFVTPAPCRALLLMLRLR